MKIEEFKELLAQHQPTDTRPLKEALNELKQISVAAANGARAAHDAYFNDASTREMTIQERIATLTKKHDSLQTKIEGFKKPLVEATVKQDKTKLNEIQGRMRSLEVDKQQVANEIEMLQNAHITGAPELYDDAVEKNTRFLEAKKEYEDCRGALCRFALKQEAIFSSIVKEMKVFRHPRWGTPVDIGGAGRGPDMEKLSKHFHAEELASAQEEARGR